MNLLKQSLVLTLSAVCVLSMAYSETAGADKLNKEDAVVLKANVDVTNEAKFKEYQALRGAPGVAQNYDEWVALQSSIMLAKSGTGSTRAGDLTANLADSYGDSWNGNELCINENCVTLDGVNDDGVSASIALGYYANGDYAVTCGGGTYMSEVSWNIVEDATGNVLLAGGAPFEGTLTVSDDAPPVPGCTDDTACNYDPDATEDDGSCCSTTCTTISCGGGSWGSEVSWNISDEGGNEVYAGGAPYEGDGCFADGN